MLAFHPAGRARCARAVVSDFTLSWLPPRPSGVPLPSSVSSCCWGVSSVCRWTTVFVDLWTGTWAVPGFGSDEGSCPEHPLLRLFLDIHGSVPRSGMAWW